MGLELLTAADRSYGRPRCWAAISEPSAASFLAPATNTLAPTLRSAAVPGAYLAMVCSGGTMTFFSPSLYLTSNSRPSLPATVVATTALVMVLPGRLSHGTKPVGDHALLQVQEDVDRVGLLAAVGLRHRRHADKRAFLDVVERGLLHRRNPRRLGELHRQVCAVARLDRQRRAVDLRDLAADAHRRRLLGETRRCRRNQRKSGHAQGAPRQLVHGHPPERSCRQCQGPAAT